LQRTEEKKNKLGNLNQIIDFYGLYKYLLNSISPDSLKFLNIGTVKGTNNTP